MDENFALSARELPHSIEAEQGVIGSILADPSVISEVLEHIKPDHFYSPQHKRIFEIIVRLFTTGEPIDVITVLNESEKEHIFSTSVEGRRYFAEIADTLPTAANVSSYC